MVEPLVSILIHNYNYGRYLRECLLSVLEQSYQNIEVIFSDNNSEDNSWEIAMEMEKRYPEKITLIRNRKNFGAEANFRNCYEAARGKYFVSMCSDDVMCHDYIEKCISVFQSDSSIGFVMVHRSVLNEEGDIIHEPSFYNESCIIEGKEQAAVYMMAAVNPSISQVMYDRQRVLGKYPFGALLSRWYSARILDFNLCMSYSMGYIAKPLLKHREHGGNHSSSVAHNLIELFGFYVLNHHFYELAEIEGYQNVSGRLDESVDKLGELSLRYAVRALRNDEVAAKRYYYLSIAINPELEDDENFVLLGQYWNASETEKEKLSAYFDGVENLTYRAVSYDPPQGSLVLNI